MGPFRDRVKQAVSVGGSGTLTLGAAATNYQAFQAGDDGIVFPYTIEDGSAWETGYGTYTHSGTTFARTTRRASSTGSALTVSTSAFVFGDAIADQLTVYENLMRLDAVPLSVTGATTLTISKWHTCSGTSYTAGLPAASGNSGKYLGVRITATGFVTLDGNASETIDGSLTRLMWAGESAILYCDGSNWFKVSGKAIPLTCFMRLSADQSSIASATETTILLNATDTDNSGAVANLANNRMVIPRTSNYDLTAFIQADSGASFTASRWITSINRDPNTGSYAILLQREVSIASGSYGGSSPIGFSIPLTANDKLQISLYQNNGGAQSAYGNPSGAATHLSLKEVPNW